MTEKAIIRSVDGRIAKMGCGPAEGCESCSSSFCSADKREFEAINQKGFELNAGDIVDVYLAPGKTIAAGFLVLIVPLILFATGYIFTGRFSPESTEGARALVGLCGLAAGFALSYYYSKRKRESSMPVIVAVKERSEERSDTDSIEP